VARRLASVGSRVESPNDVFVPHPVVAEIRFASLFAAITRAPWTDDVSQHFASTKADLERRGVRFEDMDVIIAAHALAMAATLVTRNVRRFSRVRGLTLETWE
jgi:tRNA(fMet)-specific endonuclease VapC